MIPTLSRDEALVAALLDAGLVGPRGYPMWAVKLVDRMWDDGTPYEHQVGVLKHIATKPMEQRSIVAGGPPNTQRPSSSSIRLLVLAGIAESLDYFAPKVPRWATRLAATCVKFGRRRLDEKVITEADDVALIERVARNERVQAWLTLLDDSTDTIDLDSLQEDLMTDETTPAASTGETEPAPDPEEAPPFEAPSVSTMADMIETAGLPALAQLVRAAEEHGVDAAAAVVEIMQRIVMDAATTAWTGVVEEPKWQQEPFPEGQLGPWEPTVEEQCTMRLGEDVDDALQMHGVDGSGTFGGGVLGDGTRLTGAETIRDRIVDLVERKMAEARAEGREALLKEQLAEARAKLQPQASAP